MTFTEEQINAIKEAIASNAYTGVLKPLADLGLVIRTTQDEETHKENLRLQIRGEEDVPAYTNIETAIKEVLDVEKKDGEKTSAYLKRVMTEFKEKHTAIESELEGLKKNSNPTEAQKQRIDTLEALVNSQKSDFEKQLADAKKELVDYKTSSLMDQAIAEIRALPLNVPDALKNDILEARVAKFKAETTLSYNDKGVPVLIKEGKEILDTSTLNPKPVSSVLKEYFNDIELKQQVITGTGADKNKTNQPLTGQIVVPNTVKTKVELHSYLTEQGLLSDSKEFIEAYESSGKDLPLR